MIIEMPDSEPGRCLNHRRGRDAQGYPTSKRCLDYEGHEGRCTFQDDPAPAPRVGEAYTRQEPKQWVLVTEEQLHQMVPDDD